MISVATTFDLDRNPSSFFPMEIPRVSSASSPDPESRASESIDLSLSVHGLKTGDMVWGKVKSHPWWPGFIYNEAFATPSVRRSRQENHVLVAFFGDSSYGWFDPSELIPFSSNFLEMSKQTTLRSFLIAVDEAVDEFSRRAALGLTCNCRNPKNFRPRKLTNYFAVDVPGFERGGIYSADQIVRSRDEFVPGETLAFARRLALAPTGADTSDVARTKRISVALAYRQATYEEFDVPYAEAFGVQLESQALDSPEDEPEKFAPRVALFSGPLVTAEAGGSICKSNNNYKKEEEKKKNFQKHSSSSSATIFPPSASNKKKKNEYLLKKRDEDPSSSTLPDGCTQTVLFHTKTIKDGDDDQRKPDPTWSTPPPAETEMPVMARTALPVTEPPVVLVNHKPPPDDSKRGGGGGGGIGGGSEPSTEGESSSGGKVTNDKAKKTKRPGDDDFDDNNQLVKEKKKRKEKKIEELLLAQGPVVSTLKKHEDSRPELTRTPGPNVPKIDIGPLEFPMLLRDFKVLATEGVDCIIPSVVGDIFLKFRSLVCEKSLVLPLAIQTNDQEIRPRKPSSISHTTKEQRKEQSGNTPKVKIGSLFSRSSDPAKADKKRGGVHLSDRQEEASVKRLRKLDQLKSFANEKTAATSTPVRLTDKNDVSAPPKSSSRQEPPLLPLPPKKPSPTNLILKFPPGSSLPSIPNLKARFARFGQLIVDRCRVIWDTNSCRVQYKYKTDALEAYSYAKDNNLFGQIPVKYIVREVELPSSKSEPERLRPSDSQPESSAAQFMPGNGNGNANGQSRPMYNQLKPAPVKSILKRPGEDVVKENQRVKFKLAGDDSKPEMPSAAVSYPPSLAPQVQLRSPSPIAQQEVQQYGGGSAEEERNSREVSHKMLSMLHRCNDIVTGLRSLPGFSPYRPL